MGKESRLHDRLIYADGMKTIPMKLPAEGPGDRDKPPHLTHTHQPKHFCIKRQIQKPQKTQHKHITHKHIKESLKQSQKNNE